MNAGESVNLNFLRAVAVSLVFFDHLGSVLGVPGLDALGHFGVLLFFVHTALVLMLSMERQRGEGAALYGQFMVRRIFRIYPLSVLAVLLLALAPVPRVGSALVGFGWMGWRNLASNLALTQNVTGDGSPLIVLWSLPFEVQMYLALPFLYLWLRKRGNEAAIELWSNAMALTAVEYIFRYSVILPIYPSDQWMKTGLITRYFPCFCGGLVAWQLLRRRKGEGAWPAWLWPVFVVGVMVVYRLLWLVRREHPWPAYGDVLAEGVLCGGVGVAIPFFGELEWRWVNRASRVMARYSYGIYIVHGVAIWAAFTYLDTGYRWWNAVVAMAMTGAAACGLYHAVELPLIEVGKCAAAGAGRMMASISSVSWSLRPGMRQATEGDGLSHNAGA